MDQPVESKVSASSEPKPAGTTAAVETAGAPGDTTVRLYSPNQAALATFLGSPLAGGYLMFRNLRRLGKPGAMAPLWLGFGTTAVLVVVGAYLPDAVGRALPAVATMTWWQVAKSWQGALFAQHVEAGGGRESGWRAAGVGLLFMLAVLAAILPLFMFSSFGESPRIVYGESAVIYEDGATEQDAQRVGEAMESTLRASAGGLELRLRRTPGLVLSFVVIERRWEEADTVAAFADIQHGLTEVLGEPITVELTDDWLRPQKTLAPVP